jgi:multidrug efflux pump subunit AcrB
MFINTKQEFLPDIRLGIIDIEVEYDGATPDEVEKSVTLALEENLKGIDGVAKMTSSSSEGLANVSLELYRSANKYQVYQEVKSAVDSISTFPNQAETPIVSLASDKRDVMEIMFYGDADELEIHKLAQEVKQQLIAKENISLIEIEFTKKRELTIQVNQDILAKYNLTLADIANKINAYSTELGAGTLYTKNNDILVKIDNKSEDYQQIANTPILISQNGTVLHLADIAQISNGFAENETEINFNNKPGVVLTIYTVSDETPVGVRQDVFEFLDNTKFPESIGYQILDDDATMFKNRADILVKNAILGLVLIMVILGTFLDPRLAFWVMLGLPVSIIGSFLIIPNADVSINLISMFAFIITLGVVVDDAIIVGENIYQKRLEGLNAKQAAIAGTVEMAPSVIFAILTNIMAFAPILFVSGEIGQMYRPVPVVMIAVLVVSLVESLYILPRHLSKTSKKENSKFIEKLNKPRIFLTKKLDDITISKFTNFVTTSIKNRYSVLAVSVGMIIISAGLIAGGLVELGDGADIEADSVSVSAEFAYGNPYQESLDALDYLSASLKQTLQQYNLDINNIDYDTLMGQSYDDDDTSPNGMHKLSLRAQLPKNRDFSAVQFAQSWEENTAIIPGLKSLAFSGQQNFAEPIRVELSHIDKQVLEQSAKKLMDQLASIQQIRTLKSSNSSGKLQYSLKLSDKAISLGLTSDDLAQQVRDAFYGAEAFTQQVKYDEVKYLVKLSKDERSDITTLENLDIKLNDNSYAKLYELADISIDTSYTSIDKTDGKLIIAVLIDVASNVNEDIFTTNLENNFLVPLVKSTNGLTYSFEGKSDDDVSFEDLEGGFLIAVGLIYILLVLLFNDYFKPFIIISSIPFGVVGAILGHFILQTTFGLESMIGVLALAGIVVNNGLVLMVTINRYKEQGLDTNKALILSCQRRFRPIVLTSLTTFIGLVPILLETSHEAVFLIPMVISISFGLVYSTFITLALVPSLYKIFEDLKLIK